MGATGAILLSVLVLFGVLFVVFYAVRIWRNKHMDNGFKLFLSVPENAQDSLEGVVRTIFSEDIPEKLLTNGKLYLIIPRMSKDVEKIVETLGDMYPIEVLPGLDRYCMITEGSKPKDLRTI